MGLFVTIAEAAVETLIAKLPDIEAAIGAASLHQALDRLGTTLANAALACSNYREQLKAKMAANDKAIADAEDKLRNPPTGGTTP